MIKKLTLSALCFALVIALPATAGNFGVGLHYWTAVDDIDVDELDDSGVSWVVSYQGSINDLFNWEADLEIFTDDYAGIDETVYAPQAFLLLGDTFYGGVGVGINYADGDFADDPFYSFRVGFEWQVSDAFALDINANYIFVDWDNFDDTLGDIDGDSITLGVALRFGGN